MKRTMLFFGSFNPIHKGHIALAEYVLEHGLCDEVVLVVSPQSPYKQAEELAPEMARFDMAEIACAASRYPEQIKPSVVEFLLPKPSYTIDTLRYLVKNHGEGVRFSILVGSDQLPHFDGWKEYERVLEFPVYVYPRALAGSGGAAGGGEAAYDAAVARFAGRMTMLDGAPLQPFAATGIRAAIARLEDTSQWLDGGVADYIRRNCLWSKAAMPGAGAAGSAPAMTDSAGPAPASAEAAAHIERGKQHYSRNEWGEALNAFNRALELDDSSAEARQFVAMIQEILEFRYKDIYNP